ncbi:RluA family pseudouridine synthase [Fulvivirga lutimaris]|uniref:RluA family pseudouridine synthase n=1 Tax=Fulvivirga lutimaris TaxID=1819566 RepID=UPI0012BBACAF|nr:RNA pseudouridine synthase [Fulvivirga lutimaris]MTI41896.1 RNA pseudouridine synthase [Fulvivirga lutimaris]
MAQKIKFRDLVIWEDEDYWVINKPPFISTLEDRALSINILSLAREENPAAQVCHRLDKETSGALIIAKNPEAYRHMSMQFEARKVEKVYHAVADGIHDFNDEVKQDKILKLSNGTVKIDRAGKEATTTLNTLQAYKFHTLVECKPLTGRMHQIRIHLAHTSASITGDTTYGGKLFYLSSVKKKFNLKKEVEEQPLIKRLALHAYLLSFDTLKGKREVVNAAYPKDFKVLVHQLEKNK